MGYQKITHSVSVYRLKRTGTKEQYDTTPTYTGLDIGIFPASPDILAVYPGEASFQIYEGYIYESVTLLNGDKLTYGADEYIVRGVPQIYDFNQMYYQRVMLEKKVGT